MQIIWTPKGKSSLLQIQEYIAKDSPLNAENFFLKVLEEVDVLEENPLIGRIIPEINEENRRELIYGNYRILYYVDDKVYVFRVIHSKRNFNQIDLKIDL